MSLNTVSTCFLLACLQVGSYGSDCRTSKPDSELSRLKKQLSCGYSISTAPQAGQNSSTLVHLYLVLRRFTFNEEFEIIHVYYGAYMVWMDVRLKWDPSEFGNIKELYTNSSLIWTPKFGWVNINADIDSLLKGMAHCLLRWSGYVMCISWSSIHTICQTDITHWPYDSQVCEAQLAPWKLQHEELELLVDGNMVG
ncbi:Acetylcholine receptor subunit alpha-like 2 [Zootermopsis nevadensis]|uniref:Acetylcholine receptor subunit alpha-like 2 n=1 Tax=Zootermopsis nevadensis TaxID=136037 RepID=A0A067R5W5_ZOONE|nr:Acetylcholine receptor subunit alpha-like 2 [Zootermopsis nevadensis]